MLTNRNVHRDCWRAGWRWVWKHHAAWKAPTNSNHFIGCYMRALSHQSPHRKGWGKSSYTCDKISPFFSSEDISCSNSYVVIHNFFNRAWQASACFSNCPVEELLEDNTLKMVPWLSTPYIHVRGEEAKQMSPEEEQDRAHAHSKGYKSKYI